jgi:hypothetical protein
MHVSEVARDFGLAAFGLALCLFMRWQVRDDDRMRRAAASRWRWDRRTKGKLRRGEISMDEHIESWIRGQRLIVKWIATPFMAIWVLAWIAGAIHVLISH